MTEEPPKELWRVNSVRIFDNQPLNHTRWCSTEEYAKQHASWIESVGGSVLSVTKYAQYPPSKHEPDRDMFGMTDEELSA